jgi:hypothetical protein
MVDGLGYICILIVEDAPLGTFRLGSGGGNINSAQRGNLYQNLVVPIASLGRVYVSSSAPQSKRNTPPGGRFLRSICLRTRRRELSTSLRNDVDNSYKRDLMTLTMPTKETYVPGGGNYQRLCVPIYGPSQPARHAAALPPSACPLTCIRIYE